MRINPSLPPPFHEIGEYNFQRLTADIFSKESKIRTCTVYGNRGQKQYGIDVLATFTEVGVEVAQCKCYQRMSEADVVAASEEFLLHLTHWREHGIKRFVLVAACEVTETKVQEQANKERNRFHGLGIIYELWGADEIERKLRRHRDIVRKHFDSEWEIRLCGVAVPETLVIKVNEELRVYHDFVDLAVLALHMKSWEWLCDALFRQIMPVEFPDGIYRLSLEHFRAILPGTKPQFEGGLNNLVRRSRDYLDHYMAGAETHPGDPRIMAKKRYRAVADGNYMERERLLAEHNKWDRNCTMLLFNLVRALNEFAQVVRIELMPDFFRRSGNFCVHDSMGLMGGSLVETWHVPSRYFTKDELDAPSPEEKIQTEDIGDF